jgi:hypothetical protein
MIRSKTVCLFSSVLVVINLLVPYHVFANKQVQLWRLASNCSWVSTEELYNRFNRYGLLNQSVGFVPPHTRGDRDFYGHGPIYTIVVDTRVNYYGVVAEVYMKAEETQADWTTAEGKSRPLWFLALNKGWIIRTYEVSSGATYPVMGKYGSSPIGHWEITEKDKDGHQRGLKSNGTKTYAKVD